MWMCVCVCVYECGFQPPVWSPPLHSGNYFYQGLDAGKGGERWKDVRAGKGGSRFTERERWQRSERNGERRKEIEVSSAVSVLLPFKRRVCTLSKHELEDNSSNLGKIRGAAKHNYFQDSGDWKALWIVDDHHKLDVASVHLLPLQ